MKGKKIIIISIVINILLIGVIYNFIIKEYLNNEKIIVKAMTETEYEKNIADLNQSHENYVKLIKESKTKIASAITDMGVATSNEATPDIMSSNIRSIARDASSINYDNASSDLTSINVQGAVDELKDSLDALSSAFYKPLTLNNTNIDTAVMRGFYLLYPNTNVTGTFPTELAANQILLLANSNPNSYGIQLAIGFGSNKIAIRNMSYNASGNGTWTNWRYI